MQHNDLELVTRLIRAGAKVNVKNDFGSTPMAEAAIAANAALLGALLEAGADVESPNADGQTALMVVARTSQVDAARLLIQRGANVNAVEKWRGQTALMWAVAQHQPAMVRELLARGAQVNARSTVNNWQRQVTAEPRAIYRPFGGLTPLLYAAREGCVECARALVEKGAEINLADPEALSPLLTAIINMQFDTAAYLIAQAQIRTSGISGVVRHSTLRLTSTRFRAADDPTCRRSTRPALSMSSSCCSMPARIPTHACVCRRRSATSATTAVSTAC